MRAIRGIFLGVAILGIWVGCAVFINGYTEEPTYPQHFVVDTTTYTHRLPAMYTPLDSVEWALIEESAIAAWRYTYGSDSMIIGQWDTVSKTVSIGYDSVMRELHRIRLEEYINHSTFQGGSNYGY